MDSVNVAAMPEKYTLLTAQQGVCKGILPPFHLLPGQRQGGHVRKGERATPVVYWKWRTPEELAQRADQTGKEDVAPCTPLVSAVFNFEQVESVTRPAADLPPSLRTENGAVNGIVLGCCLCAAGLSRPWHTPTELSRILEVLSLGASRWLGGCC